MEYMIWLVDGWNLVAAFYDNGNENLVNGNATNQEFFENVTEDDGTNYYKLKEKYIKYWDIYEVADEAKKNKKITVDGTELTQTELWNKLEGGEFENKRLQLTEQMRVKQSDKKGIGMNEVSGSWSYLGYVRGQNQLRFKTKIADSVQTLGRTWNEDMCLLGGGNAIFIMRGGAVSDGLRCWYICKLGA